MAQNDDTLVLTDGEGGYYAVPRTALEDFRVADEHREALEDAVGVGEVAGFGAINTTRSNIKNSGAMTSLGFYSLPVPTPSAGSGGTLGSNIAIKEQGVK